MLFPVHKQIYQVREFAVADRRVILSVAGKGNCCSSPAL